MSKFDPFDTNLSKQDRLCFYDHESVLLCLRLGMDWVYNTCVNLVGKDIPTLLFFSFQSTLSYHVTI